MAEDHTNDLLSHRRTPTNPLPSNADSAAAAGGTVVGGSRSDAPGGEADKADATTSNVMWTKCVFILVSEFCERMAYYGFQGSLVLFLTRELNYKAGTADTLASVWGGLCYVTPLLGGFLADTHLGRYKTILIFMFIYLVGLILATVAAQHTIRSPYVFFPGLFVIAFGTGGIKPNVSTLGADQFDDSIPAQAKEKLSYFNWFYMSINMGALVSFTVIAWLCQNVSFSIGYSVPTISMGLAILVFWLGSSRYKMLPPVGSALERFFKIIWQGCCHRRSRRELNYWLDYAKEHNGGDYPSRDVEDAKYVVRLVPFLCFYIVYWGCQSQMSTTWYNQGCQLNLNLGSFTLPVAALNIFNTLSIVLLIPVFNFLIYPGLEKCGVNFTPLKKIACGFMFAILAMITAAVLEIVRLKHFEDGNVVGKSICSNAEDPDANQMVNISVFWQVPQFVFVGISEILASVTALDFFYTQSPENLRSAVAALNLLTAGLGQWITALLIPLVNSRKSHEWIAHDANHGHLDWYFWLLAALMTLDLVGFVIVAQSYEYKDPAKLRAALEADERARDAEAGGSTPNYNSTEAEQRSLLTASPSVGGAISRAPQGSILPASDSVSVSSAVVASTSTAATDRLIVSADSSSPEAVPMRALLPVTSSVVPSAASDSIR